MRHVGLGIGFLASLLLVLAAGAPHVAADEKAKGVHAPEGKGGHGSGFSKYKVVNLQHKEVEFDLHNAAQKEALIELLSKGEILEAEGVEEPVNPMAWAWDLAVWTVVIFLALMVILRKLAWGPMLEGLRKREQSISDAVEEAKKARADTERISSEFKSKMDQAYAEIPKLMEDARREAEALKEDVRAQTAKEVQTERQRLRREIDTARDQALQELWNQAAQLATLISAKAIGRSLTEEDHHRLLDEAISELRQTAKSR